MDYEDSLAYALASYYYPQDPDALNLLLGYPRDINFKVLKPFIQLGDVAAFNKALIPYIQLADITSDVHNVPSKGFKASNLSNTEVIEMRKGDLLNYALRDFHFSLMGFNFDYIVPRLEIIRSLLAWNPTLRTLDKYVMSSYEIAQYLQLCLPETATTEFEPVFGKLLEDPMGLHEIWSLQRLLINMLGFCVHFPENSNGLQVAAYPSVFKHIKESVPSFLEQNHLVNEWVFVTPQQKFTVDKCLQWLDEKKILKIFTGWSGGDDEGHGINAVIFDKYLFICNRGAGGTPQTTGVAIYEVHDSGLHKELLQLFLYRSKQTEQFITSGLAAHPQIKPLHTISASSQKKANCVWLSEKMGVYACFVAMRLNQGLLLDESLKQARTLFKQWSEKDRFSLLKVYLDHPYHTRKSTDNEDEGIHFKQVIEAIIQRAPKRLKSQYSVLILSRLEDAELRKALEIDDENEFMITLKFQGVESALLQGDTSLALSYIEKFPNVNVENSSKETLLHLACRYNNIDFVNELLKRGAQPNKISKVCLSPLEEFFLEKANIEKKPEGFQGQEDLMKLMVEATPLDELAKKNVFPLHTAILQGHELGVLEILKKGFDLHLPNETGETAYHYAAMSKSETLSRSLLSKCPNVEIKTLKGRTPLHNAVCHKKLNAVQYLLERGANPNAMTLFNITPLDEIFSDEYLPIFRLLLEKGADVNPHGRFAIDVSYKKR